MQYSVHTGVPVHGLKTAKYRKVPQQTHSLEDQFQRLALITSSNHGMSLYKLSWVGCFRPGVLNMDGLVAALRVLVPSTRDRQTHMGLRV